MRMLAVPVIGRMATRTMLSGAALAVAVAACADGAPTSPVVATPAFSRADASAARIGVNDASARLTLQIQDMNARAELREQLEALSAAVDAGDAERATRALTRADRVLHRLVEANEGRETPDVSALRISLADARELIEGIHGSPAEAQ